MAQLLKRTNDHSISWTKGQGRLSYQSNIKDFRFLIDKYFASVGTEGASSPCLSLAIYDKNSLKSEFAVCDGVEDQKADYALVNALYTSVQSVVPGSDINAASLSLISSITQSIMEP